MGSPSLSTSSFEKTLEGELLCNQNLNLPLMAPLHGHHNRFVDFLFPTSTNPSEFLRFGGTSSYDLRTPNTCLNALSSLQDIYANEMQENAMSHPIHASMPEFVDLQNHHSVHDTTHLRPDTRLPQAPLPLSTLGMHVSSIASLNTVFSQGAPPSNTTRDSSPKLSTITDHDTSSHITERCCTASSDTIVDQSIAHIPGATQKRWRCCHPECTEPDKAWRRIHDARNHVRKHLGETKLFRCRKCDKYFACEKNARRHQLNQGKKYPCTVCGGIFTRVDCRNKHQKFCRKKAR